jgi:hypothetical protein
VVVFFKLRAYRDRCYDFKNIFAKILCVFAQTMCRTAIFSKIRSLH